MMYFFVFFVSFICGDFLKHSGMGSYNLSNLPWKVLLIFRVCAVMENVRYCA